MRKPDFAYAKTKAQNRAADLCLCFRFIDSTVPLLPKSEISSLYKTGFLMMWLIIHHYMSLVVRKPVLGVSDQVRHKLGCAVTEDGKRLEISHIAGISLGF